MDLPHLPEDEHESPGQPERAGLSRGALIAVAAVVVLLVIMVALHLTGVLGGSQIHGAPGSATSGL